MFAEAPVAIVDIGSNSVRLVVYSGATRAPSVIFNEKVMAGLGRGFSETGALGEEAQARALGALERFALLMERMGVARRRVVATAAVRDASNGAAFLERVRALGLEPHVIPGEEEGRLAGLGVVSAIPDADGIVGDLGGGSLELAEASKSKVRRTVSLPLGVLRLDAFAAKGEGTFRKRVNKAVAAAGFRDSAGGRPFYMVGGSWRALARLDMVLTRHPLPITHQHDMAISRPRELVRELERLDRATLRGIPSLTTSRVPTLPNAALLLDSLVEALAPSVLVVSSYGIREGLLYDDLSPAEQARDPLIEAAREAGAGLGRFAQHGAEIDAWIAPAFDDSPRAARLRLAACHLADIAWAAHPDFRAERGIDMALHGNWVAIDAAGRAMLALALYRSFGGLGDLPYGEVAGLCSEPELERAGQWGLAIRLAQRFSGGVAAALARGRLERDAQVLRLELQPADSPLLGEAVERRLKALAAALDLTPEART